MVAFVRSLRQAVRRSERLRVQPRESNPLIYVYSCFTRRYKLRDRYLLIHDFFTREACISLRHSAVEHKLLKPPTASSLRSINTSLYRLADAKSPADPLKDESPTSPHNDGRATESTPLPPSSENEEQKIKPPNTTLHPHPWENYPAFIRRLLSASLPHVHRPTKDELLAVATGWWERLKIRFKWLMIRGFRKFNTDDLSAFVSWVVVGNAIWIVIGTWVPMTSVQYIAILLSLIGPRLRVLSFSQSIACKCKVRLEPMLFYISSQPLCRICCTDSQRLLDARNWCDDRFRVRDSA